MFADNLKKYRMEKGFSQSDIAEKLFVTRQCVSKWEKGITQPDLQTLTQLSELLGVSVDALIKSGEGAYSAEKTANKKASDHNKGLFIVNIVIAVFCTIAFFVVWRFLPRTVPAHWTNGVIDRYGSRNEVFINLIVPVVFLAVDVLLFFAFRRISDKRPIYIAHGTIVLFQVAFLIFIVVTYARYLSGVYSFATCLSAALIMCASVAMHPKIGKRNYLLGVRTAETLASDVVWNKTNALASYLFAGCSVVIIVVNMIWVIKLSFLFLAAYILSAVIVVIYAKIIGRYTDGK